jgi:hypothetical protein
MTELPTASEIVLVHALRFVEPATRGIVVPGQTVCVHPVALGRVLVRAAVVSAHREEWLVLRRVRSPALMGLVSRHALVTFAGPNAARAPSGTIEGDIVVAASSGSESTPVPFGWVLRHALHPPGAPRPDPIEVVRKGALDRGVLLEGDRPSETDALANGAADRVQSMIADVRERDPDLWLAIGRAVDMALLGWMPRALLRAAERPLQPRPAPQPEASKVDLDSWQRLNKNPPSADR